MLVSAVWIGPAILGGLNVVAAHYFLATSRPVDIDEVLFVSIDWILYSLLTPGVFFLARRWPVSRPHLVRHGAIQLVFSLLFCVAWAALGTLLRWVLNPRLIDGKPEMHFAEWLLVTLPFGVAVYFAVVGVEHAIRYFDEARAQETQVARLSEQLTGARLAALQAQLNPHFLFNSLNTIAVLVRDGDKAAATTVIEQLSNVLRRTLSNPPGSEVALADELDLVRQYLAVEEARFSDRLRPVFQVDPALHSASVPGFAVQHLVENAVRHGIARRSDAGHVIIVARRDGDVLEISVLDDGPGIRVGEVRPGHGLENTRERLRTLYGDQASLVVLPAPSWGTMAVLRVPHRTLLRESSHGAED
jgi:signal transduction histidine kinase